MALRCKEGDLAVLLSGRYVGYIVTVGKFLGFCERAYSLVTRTVTSKDNVWRVHGIAEYPKLTEQDQNMQPIRPPKVAKTTETKQEIEA